MKYLLLIILATSSVACGSPVKGPNGVVYKSPAEYNDYIVSRQTKLMQNVLNFSEAASLNPDSAEVMLQQYVIQTEDMIHEIQGMPPYNGDSLLRDAAIKSFSFYKKVFEEDYMRILQLRKKGANITEDEITESGQIVKDITDEEELHDRRFHDAQESFAKKNNMKLKENEMQKKIEEKTKEN